MAEQVGVSRGSTVIAAFSTIVEWYDFTLYLYFATVLSRVFFGGGEASLLTTLGGFAVAYLMRPLGAIFFGHIGDSYGRRTTLLLSVAVMSAASEVGALLAVGISALTVSAVSSAGLDSWAWRIPFLFGAGIAVSVWIARAWMHESPDFERQRTEGTVPANPLKHTLTHHRAGVARSFAISALGSITYYVGITYVPAFLTTAGKQSEADSLWLSTGAAVLVIVVTPFIGALSDRLGRKPVLLALCALSAALPVTMFSIMSRGSHAESLIGAGILAMVAGGVSAVGAVATAEQFRGEGRLSGLALGATMATAIFGGLTPFLAQLLIDRTRWASAPGAMIGVVALCVLPVFLTMRETKPTVDVQQPTAIKGPQ